MVKRQKEKLYQSSREHKANASLRALSGTGTAGTTTTSSSPGLLPFSHCALTLTAYETPVCNAQGIVFENSAILPFVLKHGMDPCTGQKMASRDLITLNMHHQQSNDNDFGGEQQWACPILNKPFVQHSKIVAIILDSNNDSNKRLKSANVYSWQAYQELNVKANHYEDLISGQAFDKNKDVLILYDPNNDDLNRRRDIHTFFHIQNARQLNQNSSNNDSTDDKVQHGMTATRIMQQLAKNKQQQQQQQEIQDSKKRAAAAAAATTSDETKDNHEQNIKRIKRCSSCNNPDGLILARDVTGVRYTTTGGAASFTSTGISVHLDNCDRPATPEEILQAQLLVLKGKSGKGKNNSKLKNKKGLVRIVTNMGNVTVELHCDIAPRTCYNFLGLCRNGSYDGSKFHRLIPNFMIQGGKQQAATATNKNGGSSSASAAATEDESFWGNRPFPDELDDRLKHDGPGVLSMANSGPNTNRRQFFFTFKACPHLNRKHSVFGQIIDGMQVLQEMEKVPTNTDAKKDHVPLTKIIIQSTIILVDPVQEAIQLEQERLQGIIAARKKQAQSQSQQQQTTTAAAATEATSKIQSAEESNDKKDDSNNNNNTSNNDDVGHFLREQLKQRAAATAVAKKKKLKDNVVDVVEQPVVPTTSRRRPPPPPPPKATNFGNFSAW